MNSDFFKASENTEKYNSVCDIRKNRNRTNSNVIEAFSGLECPSTELHNWESHSKEYKDKFKKAKQCLQRRITTMKRFPARSAANKESRKKHIYPIQVAYAYGKDCLKKIASKSDQSTFETSVDDLIKHISTSQPNIQNYFGNSIEKSIRKRSKRNTVRSILNRSYYNDDRMNLINRLRSVGYNRLTKNNQDRIESIINEGFTRNIPDNTDENENVAENRAENGNNLNEELINRLKKEFKKKRKTKKKAAANATETTANLTNLDSILENENYKITNSHKRSEFIKKVEELSKLYIDKILIDNKIAMIDDIYKETFLEINSINSNIISKTTSKLMTKRPSKKHTGKVVLNREDIDKYDAVIARQKLGDDIVKLQNKLEDKLRDINDKIITKIESANNTIAIPLENFVITGLLQYNLQLINSKIALLNTSNKSELLEEKEKLYNLRENVKIINLGLVEVDKKLAGNLAKQEISKKILISPIAIANPSLVESTNNRLKELKEEEISIKREQLTKYKQKTTAIYDLLQQINEKYDNPFIIKEELENVIYYKDSLLSSMRQLNPALINSLSSYSI